MGKKLFIAFLLVLVMLVCAQALEATQITTPEIKLKDVPDDHWAAAAVYDLVRMGVTKGYPDGTYRGNKPITRFETAIFLSKLAKSISGDDLKTELTALKNQVVELQKPHDEFVFSGAYLGTWQVGNLLATQSLTRGGVGSYRLIVNADNTINDKANLRINFDTMDYGYFNDNQSDAARAALPTGLFALESNLKLDLADRPLDLQLTYGPGPKQHLADPTGVLPSEIGVTYMRPKTGILASTMLGPTNVAMGYYSLPGATLNSSGKIDTSQVTGKLSFELRSVKVDLTGDYITRGLFSSSERNVRAKLDLSTFIGKKVQASGSVGLGGRERSAMMLAGALNINDLWDTGTVATIKLAKIGTNYLSTTFAKEEFYFAGLDNFDRPLIPGTVQVGGALTQTVSDRVQLIGKGDLRLSSDYQYAGSNARLTASGGISYNLAPNANLAASYQVDQDKGLGDTSDIAAVGMLYKF